jgi:hypothetical protein
MAGSGQHKGHNFTVTYATENDWPVTSLRVTLRKPLPAGVAVHPRGASPWSSGRISSRTAPTGDGAFDKHFTVLADRAGDLRFLGAEVRGALESTVASHPGLWLGNDGLVCVERGHLRDRGRLEALLDELVALAVLVAGASGESSGASHRVEVRAEARFESRGDVRGEARAEAEAAAATKRAAMDPGDVQAFILACFDRRIASYEVNRRMTAEWLGRRVHGQGTLVRQQALGGHDFDFADLKGLRVEVQVAGPEELAPLVRVALQVEEGQQAAVEGFAAGAPVRFDGQIQGANPLLFTLQVVSATVSAPH